MITQRMWLGLLGAGIALTAALLSLQVIPANGSAQYATAYGYGLDKWATAWLLTRHVDPGAELSIVADRSAIPGEATAFDVPGGVYVRTGERSAFSAVMAEQVGSTSQLRRLADVVHQIEVAYWSAESTPEALSIEHGFRRLQRGSERVSSECYLRFFDSVAAAMHAVEPGAPLPRDELLAECDDSKVTAGRGGERRRNVVREISLGHVLGAIDAGERVVFVDVREPEEFAEARIPGAVNLPIYALDEAAVRDLADADLVVSYCVKDFRGFEMAKLLRRAGVRNSVILNPYGLKGWMAAGLPVAGADLLTEAEALAELSGCLSTGTCGEVAR